MGQRCSRKQKASAHIAQAGAPSPVATSGTNGDGCPVLAAPADDVVTSICALGDSYFATAGVDGWVYFYNWHTFALEGKFRAHKKSTNQVLPIGRGRVLTASNDATVRLWGDDAGDGLLPAPATASGSSASPAQTFTGHAISVVALDILDASGAGTAGDVLVTGSRDCSLRTWDIESGKELSQRKILRNVVTPCCLRRLPGRASQLVQASEDLQFRLWDLRIGGNQPAHAVHAGPDQLVCLDVSDDGNYVACGSKGLQELTKVACADQTIEALSVVGADRCLVAGKDAFMRVVELPELRVASERGPATKAYTAMGVCRRTGGLGPVALLAASGEEGVGLEMFAFPDASLTATPTLLARSG